MTRTMTRLVLAVLLLPCTGAVFVITVVLILRGSGPPDMSQLLLLWAVVYSFIGTYWVLLWRGVVRWTTRRLVLTAGATAVSLLIGAAVGVGVMAMNRALPQQPALMAGGGIVPIVWVLATVLLWRETPDERMERLSRVAAAPVCCPICGYNLSGLREARCPECGGRFTLDQLVATSRAGEERASEV